MYFNHDKMQINEIHKPHKYCNSESEIAKLQRHIEKDEYEDAFGMDMFVHHNDLYFNDFYFDETIDILNAESSIDIGVVQNNLCCPISCRDISFSTDQNSTKEINYIKKRSTILTGNTIIYAYRHNQMISFDPLTVTFLKKNTGEYLNDYAVTNVDPRYIIDF